MRSGCANIAASGAGGTNNLQARFVDGQWHMDGSDAPDWTCGDNDPQMVPAQRSRSSAASSSAAASSRAWLLLSPRPL
jgi:hypothetical protein